MNETADNLANCRIVNFNQNNLNFLLGAEIRLSSSSIPAQAQIQFPDALQLETACFSTDSYDNQLKSAVGPLQFNTYYDLTDISMY